MIHHFPQPRCFLPQVMLVVCQPNRQQRTGTQLHEALMKLLSHKVKPKDESG